MSEIKVFLGPHTVHFPMMHCVFHHMELKIRRWQGHVFIDIDKWHTSRKWYQNAHDSLSRSENTLKPSPIKCTVQLTWMQHVFVMYYITQNIFELHKLLWIHIFDMVQWIYVKIYYTTLKAVLCKACYLYSVCCLDGLCWNEQLQSGGQRSFVFKIAVQFNISKNNVWTELSERKTMQAELGFSREH